jgi:hypothetical protein
MPGYKARDRAKPPARPDADMKKIDEMIAAKEYTRAREELVRRIETDDKHAAASKLADVLFREERWESCFDGRKLDRFSVISLMDSGAEVGQDSGEIAAWAHAGDSLVLKFRRFQADVTTGVTFEFRIDQKTTGETGIGFVFDCRAADVYKQFLCKGGALELKSRDRRNWANLGSSIFASDEPGRWHRLTLVVERELLIALGDESLVYAGPSSEAKFTEDTRILLQGCRGRIRDIRIRK